MRYQSWLLALVLAVTVINYPNPFNPKGGEIATIECTAGLSTEASLHIYDMAARLVLTKVFTTRTTWDGYSDFNEKVGNGIYPYQIVAPGLGRVARGKIWVVNH